MTRYRPTYSLMSGTNDLSNDMILGKAHQAITNKVPSFEFRLDNRFDKWAGLAYLDPVTLSVDGVGILKGRIDRAGSQVMKKGGRILVLKGRGNAAALEDVISSLHIKNEQPYDIVNKIIDSYNNLRLAKDPAISVSSNMAPTTGYPMTFIWKRKNHMEMLLAVAEALGAPAGLGGQDQFYDFYVDPADGFFFEPTGQRSSGVDITVPFEVIERDAVIDSLPLKNDIWIWGDPAAGTIPLEMQEGYNNQTPSRQDPWTEGNPGDYLAGPNVTGITSDTANKVIGNSSIKISAQISSGDYGYWYMPFPFGAPYPPGGSKWPGQPPAAGFNLYNETSMTETMGEISAIGFFIKNTLDMDLMLAIKDGDNKIAVTQKVRLPGGTVFNWFTPEWKYVQLNIGPSVKNLTITEGTEPFSWENVAEIRFVFFRLAFQHVWVPTIWFDGLRFIKPLVVRHQITPPNTKRPYIKSMNWINTWKIAKSAASSLAQNMVMPQEYYLFENIGRVDVPVGQTFVGSGVTLLAREITYTMAKDEGWKVKVHGWKGY